MLVKVKDSIIGKFVYDDTQFKLQPYNEFLEKYEVYHTKGMEFFLRYIGKEKDGSKITIPEGIKNCNYMFLGTKITSTPKIPEGVVCAMEMFEKCENLKKISYPLPNSLIDATYMFNLCTKLTEIPKPLQENGLIDGERMFSFCESLVDASFTLPLSIKNCMHMFSNCTKLKKPPIITLQHKINCLSYMFYCCDSLDHTYPVKLLEYTLKLWEKTESMKHGCEWMYMHCDKINPLKKNEVTNKVLEKLLGVSRPNMNTLYSLYLVNNMKGLTLENFFAGTRVLPILRAEEKL